MFHGYVNEANKLHPDKVCSFIISSSSPKTLNGISSVQSTSNIRDSDIWFFHLQEIVSSGPDAIFGKFYGKIFAYKEYGYQRFLLIRDSF